MDSSFSVVWNPTPQNSEQGPLLASIINQDHMAEVMELHHGDQFHSESQLCHLEWGECLSQSETWLR